MQERGFYHQSSDLDGLRSLLKQGVQSAYIGYDPTATSLHVGNLMGIMVLKWFQLCGHKPVTLMGGGTVMAGDPSGKDDMRKLLSREEITRNVASIKPVFAKYLTYGNGPTDAIMPNNADWLCGLNYIDFIRQVGPHFSINRMLTLESVKSRLDREQSLSFLEFNYMIMQGYDFVQLHEQYGTRIQMGGSDQWGNILCGVELGRRMKSYDLYALTTPLLTTSSGAKMGKSAAGAVWLNADLCSPYDYYQYWRNAEDADVVRWLKIYTMLPMDEINHLAALHGAEINEAKKILAFEATKLCHGETAALAAAETARKTFEEGMVGDALPIYYLPQSDIDGGVTIMAAIADFGLVKSRGEARRLIEQGGVRVNGQVIAQSDATFKTQEPPYKIQIGKKTVFQIKVT
jgi:tyrosyl-tRNA synthetase